jgi:hypothetical protein
LILTSKWNSVGIFNFLIGPRIVAHARVLEWHGIREEDEDIIELSDSEDYDAW